MPSQLYQCSPRVVATELGDGTGVLLHLDSMFYFTLNASGLVVWRALGSGNTVLDNVVRAIVERFEVDEPTARADVDALMSQLLAERLVTVVG